MKKADQFSFPMAFTGEYPNNWAGYTFLQWTSQNAFHCGIDWNWGGGEDDYGKPVQCIANGQVVHQSTQTGIGYGTIVVVKHELTDQLYDFVKSRYNIDSHNLYSFYAHLKEEIVSEGQELERGELLGYIGRSGTSASHLHQELYKPIPGTQWRYWPTLSEGWDEARLKQYYIDTYDFIVNQPLPGTNNWAEKAEACRLELEQRDAEKRMWEDISRTVASKLNCKAEKAEIEKALQEILNNDGIAHELWHEIELKYTKSYTYPDAKQSVLEAIRSLSLSATVPTPQEPVPTEELVKEFNLFDTLFIRIFKKVI
ncbi:MAG: M23 family metallopeptidase [Patescibacteria group bacterium]|nr:M23 family metallopeptidase [Patescibacteria group bacterium]